MGLLDYFRNTRTSSAAIAKERLQILVAHERSERNKPDYLPMLQKELLEVIRKYVEVDQDAISVTMELVAMAAPQPNVLNLASVMTSFESTFI